MDLSIVIPVYNEENSINEILQKVLDLHFNSLKWEVVVVDDGSNDKTPGLLNNYAKNPKIKIINHESNQGKGMAIRTGIKNSSGSIIALQDSDLEYDPAQLPSLITPIIKGENVVYGSRFQGKFENMKLLFYLGNWFLTLLTRLLYRAAITDMETGSKVFRREVIENVELESTGFEIEPELTAKILKANYKIKEIPIRYIARDKKHKKITVRDGLIALFTLIKYRFR
jgi:glycosyltransferase involved in cell wall biosynthesis